jgi:type I restriction enzyme S subunit
MTEEWETVTLGEICPKKPQYGFIASAQTEKVGPRLLRTTDITGGTVEWSTVPFCECPADQYEKYRLLRNDIVISRMGTVGLSTRIKEDTDAVFAGYLVRFRPDPKRAHSEFVGYAVQSEQWWSYVHAVRTGTVQPNLNAQLMAAFEFGLPGLDEQRRIAEVLGALDDRIESAARLERLLGETILAEYGLALAERTDDVAISLTEAVSLVNGGAFTKGADGAGRMVIRIKELNSGPSETTVYSSISVPENKTAYPGDVLFAWSGSLGVWRWYRDEAIVNQHIFKVIAKKHPVWLGWIHVLDELERFQDIAAGKATTMGHVTKDHLERTMVPTFSESQLATLDARVEPLWEAQLQAGSELHTLQSVRSQLLPALVSGDLRVAAAEELVEAAT